MPDIREINDLIAALRLARQHGFDMIGPGDTVDGNGFPCNCAWSSALYGDTCPEHGREGIRISGFTEGQS